jgi:AbiV family abortive infection protein
MLPVIRNAESETMRPGKNTLAKLKAEVQINAICLFCDGCALFKNKSYGSAYALAVLSLEELGKLEMVDDVCDGISINPDSNPQDILDHLFSRTMFFSHRNKQMWAASPFCKSKKVRVRTIESGDLDRAKQHAFYVGYSNRRIRSPRHVSSVVAFAELMMSFKKIKEVGDLGFNGFHCFSDARSRTQARHYRGRAERALSAIRRPKRRKS